MKCLVLSFKQTKIDYGINWFVFWSHETNAALETEQPEGEVAIAVAVQDWDKTRFLLGSYRVLSIGNVRCASQFSSSHYTQSWFLWRPHEYPLTRVLLPMVFSVRGTSAPCTAPSTQVLRTSCVISLFSPSENCICSIVLLISSRCRCRNAVGPLYSWVAFLVTVNSGSRKGGVDVLPSTPWIPASSSKDLGELCGKKRLVY